MKFKVLLYTKENAYLESILDEKFTVFVNNGEQDALTSVLNSNASLIIMDKDFIFQNRQKELNNDSIFYDIPIIAYADEASNKEKTKLYESDVKFILDKNLTKEKCVQIVTDILRCSNPYTGTQKDIFIKSLLRYEDSYDIIDEVLYVANYLIQLHELPIDSAADIRATIILLSIGLKKKSIIKIYTLVSDMQASKRILSLMKHYHKPKSMEEKIIFSSLVTSKNYSSGFRAISMHESEDFEILEEAKGALALRKIFISCAHDLYVFWEYLDDVINENVLTHEVVEQYLNYLFKVLYFLLIEIKFIYVELNNADTTIYTLKIMPYRISVKADLLQKYFDTQLKTDNENIKLLVEEDDKKRGYLLIKLNITDKQKENKISQEGVKPTEEGRDKTINTSIIDSMHYKDHQKISAKEFAQEFEIEISLLEDLNENEMEVQNLLYVDEDLNKKMLTSFSKVLNYYAHFLNETIEFRDLAYSISALAEVLHDVNMQAMDKGVNSTLKIYISGIADDLMNWKNIIFIDQNTPDIHYLDASLLDNCSAIELLIHPNSQVSETEAELEFF